LTNKVSKCKYRLTIEVETIMKKIIPLLLASFLLSAAMPSVAQEPFDTQDARRAYEDGVKHYDLAEYTEALDSFKDAYRTKTDPAFLYNIAQCLRKLERLDESATFYRTYLRRAPDASNRKEVERHLADIETRLAAANPPARGPFSARDIPIAPPAQIDLAPRPATPITGRPIYERWWFWTAAGAVAAGATTTIIILARHEPTSIPASVLGSQKALP
jgi:tetratricopeptide (TPR) repeat protein